MMLLEVLLAALLVSTFPVERLSEEIELVAAEELVGVGELPGSGEVAGAAELLPPVVGCIRRFKLVEATPQPQVLIPIRSSVDVSRSILIQAGVDPLLLI